MSIEDRKRKIPRERLILAEKLYLEGEPTPAILRQLCSTFGVTTRCARKYLARVRDKLALLPKPPPEAAFHRAESMLLEAFTAARSAVKVIKWVNPEGISESRIMSAPDTGAMVAAAQRVADLYGVAAPQKVDVTSGGLPILTESDAAKILAEEFGDTGALKADGRSPKPDDH